MSWVAAAVAVGTAVYGASEQKKGQKRAASAATAAEQMRIDEQRRQFDIAQQNQQHFVDASKWAVPQLQASLSGNNNAFFNSPDYLATQEQGLSFMDRSAAARGALGGGGHSADLLKYGNQLGAQQLGNYRNSLAQLAGLGQNSAQSLGAFGANMANQIGGAYTNMGQARASSYLGRADTNTQLAGALGGVFNNYWQQRQASQAPSYTQGTQYNSGVGTWGAY